MDTNCLGSCVFTAVSSIGLICLFDSETCPWWGLLKTSAKTVTFFFTAKFKTRKFYNKKISRSTVLVNCCSSKTQCTYCLSFSVLISLVTRPLPDFISQLWRNHWEIKSGSSLGTRLHNCLATANFCKVHCLFPGPHPAPRTASDGELGEGLGMKLLLMLNHSSR